MITMQMQNTMEYARLSIPIRALATARMVKHKRISSPLMREALPSSPLALLHHNQHHTFPKTVPADQW